MANSTSRILSLLRQEKGSSQRSTAADLGISQALLSHYENGIREPGLSFICKVCDYYNVSADFLLGRTSTRDGAIFDAQSLHDASQDKDAYTRNNALALLDKKLLVNSMSILFDLLARLEEEDAITYAYQFLGTAVYRMFRHLSNMTSDGQEALYDVSDLEFIFGASNADMTLSELEYVKSLRQHAAAKKEFPLTGYAALQETYPDLYESLLQVIHAGGQRVVRTIETHQENRAK